ncbi:unnamed protein product, partial [Rotaria socialis]
RDDVIVALVTALKNADDNVRRTAVEALGRIGETGATDDVIAPLIAALGDEKVSVRVSACEALGQIGEKAATDDFIAALLTALWDKEMYVRAKACEALGRLGGKAATSSVMNELLRIADFLASNSLKNILVSASSLSKIDSNTVSKLFNFWNRNALQVHNIPLEKIIQAFSDSKIVEWCSIIALHALRRHYAVTIVDQAIIVYGNSEPVKCDMPCHALRDQLVHVFTEQEGLAFHAYNGQGCGEGQ